MGTFHNNLAFVPYLFLNFTLILSFILTYGNSLLVWKQCYDLQSVKLLLLINDTPITWFIEV